MHTYILNIVAYDEQIYFSKITYLFIIEHLKISKSLVIIFMKHKYKNGI
jgi:hypothetical protein